MYGVHILISGAQKWYTVNNFENRNIQYETLERRGRQYDTLERRCRQCDTLERRCRQSLKLESLVYY